MMERILLVEDDRNIQKLLTLELRHSNYIVDSAYDGEQALELFSKNKYNLILLDLMLPKKNGKELCQDFRKLSSLPILVLTAKDTILDKVELLDLGANDYICKPFAVEELFARIRVALRISDRESSDRYLFEGNMKLDRLSKKIYFQEKKIELTKTEFLLLEYFMKHRGYSCSRTKLIENIWGFDFDGEEKEVDVYINSLRKKLDKNGEYFHTVRGFGYLFEYRRAANA